MAKSREQYINEKMDNEAVSFNLVDQHTVERLKRDGVIEVPTKKLDVPKDMRWNEKYIASQMLKGIENGDSVDKMASSIFLEIFSREDTFNLTEKGVSDLIKRCHNSAIRNARTMTTSAENHGRLDSYKDLAAKGVVQKKEWMSTPDDRTRPTHIDIDGEEQDIEKRFSNGCMFPGDGSGPAEEVWMCRCTMTDHIIGFRRADGSISKVNYTPDRTLHDEQMEEERKRRETEENIPASIDISSVNLPENIIDSAVEYSERMSQDDIKKFNEIFKDAEYVKSENGSYYDPASNEVYISQLEASNTTAFHESTHWYDFNQNYTITEDYGKYKWITDEDGNLTGEREWISDIVTIKENAGFSEYVAWQWDKDIYDYETRTWIDSGSKLDIRNFVEKVRTSDTYGWGREANLVEQDMKAINAYLEKMGVSRTDPDYVHLSDFISAISYDANLGSLATGGHSYDYWVQSQSNRVTEITAGYNLLRATGREDLIAVERDLAPNLMKLIETEWAKIW